MPPLVTTEGSPKQRLPPSMIVASTVAPIVRDYRTAVVDGGSSFSLKDRLVAVAPPTVPVPPPCCEPSKRTPAPAHPAPTTILSVPPRFEASASAVPQHPRRPPPSPAATLRRHRSEPVNACSERRSIFERYWKLEGDRNTCCSGPTSSGCGGGQDHPVLSARVPHSMVIPASQRLDALRTSRSRSASLPDNRGGDLQLCYRHLGPPQGCSLEHKEHYTRRSNLPTASETSLPPLPVPLQRFYSDGRGSSLRGMYPIMVSPKPILRQSSYRNLLPTDLSGPPLQSMVMVLPGVADSLNLTRSVSVMGKQPSPHQHDFAGMGRRCPPNFADEDTSETASNTSTGSSTEDRSDDAAAHSGTTHDDDHLHHNHNALGVSFDPRITVTEFDDPSPRAWFTDADLERFRVETVLVAQRYLLQNPAMIEEYNKPRLDPVTGTMRKRALYSLPALSAADATDSDGPEPSAAERHRNSMNELAAQEIQSILIVDRNALVLDLFRRSLQSLFPHARITTESSGDEAFRLFRAALLARPPAGAPPGKRAAGFDLVVADERLHQPLAASGTPILTTGKSSGSTAAAPLRGLSVAQVTQRDPSRRHVRHSSLQNLPGPGSRQKQPRGCSGSELLRNMARLVEDRRTAAVAGYEASPWCAPDIKSCPLLIGVSVDPDHDGPRLRECGADVVWGKPPPSMNAVLRDELVARLIRKRDGAAPTTTATTSKSTPA